MEDDEFGPSEVRRFSMPAATPRAPRDGGAEEDCGGGSGVGEGDLGYLREHGVAELLQEAVTELLKAKPRDPGMWLASYLAGAPSVNNLIGRLDLLERDVGHQLRQKAESESREQYYRRVQQGFVPPMPRATPSPATEGVTPQEPPPLPVGGPSAGLRARAAPNEVEWMAPVGQGRGVIFHDYLKMLGLGSPGGNGWGNVFIPKQHVVPDPRSALIVVGMQNDYFPQRLSKPLQGGRSPVPEGELAVPVVRELLHAFARHGSAVYAVREYRPQNHIAFLGSGAGGRQMPHAMQGSPGSEFHCEIADALGELMEDALWRRSDTSILERREDVDTSRHRSPEVAFHNYAPNAFCVGALGETSRTPGWVALNDDGVSHPIDSVGRAKQKSYQRQQCRGAAMLPLVGQPWNESLVNIPPALVRDPEDEPRLVDKMRGLRRLYVCGMPLDTVVLETAVAAAEMPKGPDEVYIVLDACRPGYVLHTGAYSGFLTDPSSVLGALRTNPRCPIRFISAGAFFAAPERRVLQARLHRMVAAPAAPPPRPFPEGIGPFGMYSVPGVGSMVKLGACPTFTQEGTYDLSAIPAVAALADFGVKMKGRLTALSIVSWFPAEKARVGIPEEADTFCWAYPLDGMGPNALDCSDAPATTTGMHFEQCMLNPTLAFAAMGGWLYFKAGTVIGATALCVMGKRFAFRPMQPLPPTLRSKLIAAKRFERVTVPAMIDAGARWFTWITPSDCGNAFGFAYLFHEDPDDDGPDIMFRLIDPVLTAKRHHRHAQRAAADAAALASEAGSQASEASEPSPETTPGFMSLVPGR
eukprot:TRINITY_DN27212_c0_g1_i1.p1 TRINITY_DN27212_c0_g1~~TRINITY_DN27212_c0_g1_i1.p1  ORF type:complete len:811 (+),score=201.85 TRINITY_DN27212_c0_g1_i1:75-2507(+)